MTTKVHVVNFGPDVVEVTPTQGYPQRLYQHQYADFYVYDNQDITIKELKQENQKGETKNADTSS